MLGIVGLVRIDVRAVWVFGGQVDPENRMATGKLTWIDTYYIVITIDIVQVAETYPRSINRSTPIVSSFVDF